MNRLLSSIAALGIAACTMPVAADDPTANSTVKPSENESELAKPELKPANWFVGRLWPKKRSSNPVLQAYDDTILKIYEERLLKDATDLQREWRLARLRNVLWAAKASIDGRAIGSPEKRDQTIRVGGLSVEIRQSPTEIRIKINDEEKELDVK